MILSFLSLNIDFLNLTSNLLDYNLFKIKISKKISIMEKYRKWTDEATGVNPFIIAD